MQGEIDADINEWMEKNEGRRTKRPGKSLFGYSSRAAAAADMNFVDFTYLYPDQSKILHASYQ